MKNIKVVIYSVIALIFMYLTFAVDWLFIVPAAILSYLSQREMMRKKK